VISDPPGISQPPDPWFWSHYRDAAGIVLDLVPKEYFAAGKTVVDFGCGDGATTLGIAHSVQARIIGIDLHRTFEHLPDLAKQNLGAAELPSWLTFEQNTLGAPLPLGPESVDLIYSWSVFEHVADVKGMLSEFARVVRPGGAIFIQIEPLFFGPFGSHMQRLVNEPWAHILHAEPEFIAMLEASTDQVPESDKDILYRTNNFDDVKRYLIKEYRGLNQITADHLVQYITDEGFIIKDERRIRVEGLAPSDDLLSKHPADLLLTNQIVVLAVKPSPPSVAERNQYSDSIQR
jgi:2-polyprenyl-3-methyl-5-hydroxy-6-metoxy-1,4-benzoquinol methylase